MSGLINEVGAFKLRLQPDRLAMLVRSIVAQQISTQVARVISQRLYDVACNRNGELCVKKLRKLSLEELRAVGLSRQKSAYVQDLAEHIATGKIQLERIHELDNAEIIRELTAVHGIGEWTAQMFLMFCLGRPDVFPHGDYGIRAGIRNLYGLAELPDKKQSLEIAAPWAPYSTIASWYLWRSLELPAAKKK